MTPWHQSRYAGLFRTTQAVPRLPHDPEVHVWAGSLLREPDGADDRATGGIGWTADAAFGAGVGEALERHGCRPLPTDDVVTASCQEWPRAEPFVQLRRWVLYHPEQYRRPRFPFAPPDETTPFRWVCCRRAVTGEPWWVPVEMVYLDVPPGAAILGPSISTGLACGRPGDPVVLRGAQEVIERDAVVGAWWGRYPLHEHDPAEVWSLLGETIRGRVVRPNLAYRFYRVAGPFSAHVALVTVTGPDLDGGLFAIGSACRSTRRAAWEKALLEAIQGRLHLRQMLRFDKAEHFDAGWPIDFTGHALFYTKRPDLLARTPLHSPSAGPDPDAGVEEPLAALVERLGPERPVLVRHLTRPEWQEIGETARVVRVVVPGLQPLHGHHGYPFLGGPLWRPRGLAEWADVPPHPFP